MSEPTELRKAHQLLLDKKYKQAAVVIGTMLHVAESAPPPQAGAEDAELESLARQWATENGLLNAGVLVTGSSGWSKLENTWIAGYKAARHIAAKAVEDERQRTRNLDPRIGEGIAVLNRIRNRSCVCGSKEPYQPSQSAEGYEFCPKCFKSRRLNPQIETT